MKFSALLCLVPLASARVVRHAQQIPMADNTSDDIPTPQDQTKHTPPSIGLQFTTTHAMAAARYDNGTTRDLVKMEGEPEYQDLMRRWMGSQSGYSGPLESSDDMVLSSFLIRLRTAIEKQLDGPVEQAALALSPLAPGLQRKFQKAMVVASFAPSQDSVIVYEEAMATHAALKPASPCTKKSQPGHLQHVLFLAFDDGAFSASMHEYACRDYSPQAHMISRLIRADLGWWHLPMYDAPREKFWAQVQESIVHVLSPQEKAPGRIVLLGSHAADAEFKNKVEDILWRELEVDVSGMLSVNERDDSEWLAARGAAELASRHAQEES
ncbi:hypothetical protein yc1106_01705 [Curvularia clavata]|uniref:Uncharacterized protein n=1 Tax=Curvularia clavata TaxID=95742 RepID=A0A9Q8Z1Y7_CURCL|nr:hypothetical protein yc1106_01705 [Curvularia clavata]